MTELNDGYSFHFPTKLKSVEKLVEFINYEQKNNPSIKFELIFQQEEMVLQINGDVAKDFVKTWAPNWVSNRHTCHSFLYERKYLDSWDN